MAEHEVNPTVRAMLLQAAVSHIAAILPLVEGRDRDKLADTRVVVVMAAEWEKWVTGQVDAAAICSDLVRQYGIKEA